MGGRTQVPYSPGGYLISMGGWEREDPRVAPRGLEKTGVEEAGREEERRGGARGEHGREEKGKRGRGTDSRGESRDGGSRRGAGGQGSTLPPLCPPRPAPPPWKK